MGALKLVFLGCTPLLFCLSFCCGRDLDRPDRIVGGTPVEKGAERAHVSLQGVAGNHFCGGTLIRKNWILTAAHCTYDYSPQEMRAAVGSNNLREFTEYLKLSKMIRHSEFDRNTFQNDIALYKISGDPEIKHSGIPMPVDYRASIDNETCHVIGFGRVASGGAISEVLLSADVAIRTQEFCRNAFSAANFHVSDGHVCAGGGDKDACQGDSGGPLKCCPPGEECMVSGITSWGIGCATRGLPGVYTRVAHYKAWIDEQIANN